MSEHDTVTLAHAEMEGSDLGGEQVLVDFRRGRYFGLNPTGTFLFSLIREPVSIERLVDALVDRYGIGREQAARDVVAFVESMQEHQLIVVHSNGEQA